MKQIWLHIVETYLRIGFVFYYKKFTATYDEEIPKNKAILFLSNHQNALLDPLLITIKTNKKNYFLTRANVFSNPIIARVLKSLQMLPVYRVRDGMKTILKNKAIFSQCASLLHQKQSIILFPEASHSLLRRVRPLSKGFTRIVEETIKTYPDTPLLIIPVGLNFQNLTEFGDSVTVKFGKSIDTARFLNNEVLDVNSLKTTVFESIKQLTTHIEEKNYDETIQKLNNLKVDFTQPKAVNECLQSSFKYLGKIVKPASKNYKTVKIIVAFFHLIPFIIWKKIVFSKIKEPEFIGTFRFVMVAFVAPFFLIIEFFIAVYFFGKSIAIGFLIAAIVLPLIAIRLK
ncbi:MAG: 1-acyl-sn-glycerol-3-phosphate acyltransferase [Flavobacteriales bacterium]